MVCQRKNGSFQAAHTVPIITDNQAGRPGTYFKGYLPYARFSMELYPAADLGRKKKATKRRGAMCEHHFLSYSITLCWKRGDGGKIDHLNELCYQLKRETLFYYNFVFQLWSLTDLSDSNKSRRLDFKLDLSLTSDDTWICLCSSQ